MDTSAPNPEQQLAPITDELLAALSAARALYDNAPCGLLALNAELRCVNINQTLLDWLGMDREDVIVFKTLEDLASPECRSQASTHVEQLLISGRTEPLTLSLCRANGDFLQARLTSTAIYDAEGQFLHTSTMVSARRHPAQHHQPHPGAAGLLRQTSHLPFCQRRPRTALRQEARGHGGLPPERGGSPRGLARDHAARAGHAGRAIAEL